MHLPKLPLDQPFTSCYNQGALLLLGTVGFTPALLSSGGRGVGTSPFSLLPGPVAMFPTKRKTQVKKFYVVLSGSDVEFAIASRDLVRAIRAAADVADKERGKSSYVLSVVTKCNIVDGEAEWDDAE